MSKLVEKLERKLRSLRSAQEALPEVDLDRLRKQIAPRVDRLNFEQRRELGLTLVHQVRISPNGEFQMVMRPILISTSWLPSTT